MKRNWFGALDAGLAAIGLYTRIPIWRLHSVPSTAYEQAIDYWPMVGLLTGSSMAVVYMVSRYFFVPAISVVFALVARLLLTGAFHEDGLGDFFDGLGGGRDREHILAIMKDSRVGSYAVIAFVIYYLLADHSLRAVNAYYVPSLLLCADVWGKAVSYMQTRYLPYARTSATSKLGFVYVYRSVLPVVLACMISIVPLGISLGCEDWMSLVGVLFAPCMSASLLIAYIKRKIGGYTGDTCGAIALLSELSAWVLASCLLS